MSITVTCIRDERAFQELESEWHELYATCTQATLFSSWEWMTTWWENFSNQFQRDLYILAIRDADALIGLAPWQIVTGHPLHLVTGRVLGFIGTIESDADSIVSQYNDLLVRPGREEAVCSAIRTYLNKNEDDWNVLDFQYLLQDALILHCFQDTTKYARQTICNGFRYSIPRFRDLNDYLNSLSRRWRKMYRKKSRLIQRDGTVVTQQSGEQLTTHQALDLLKEMHGARWIKRIGVNKFNEPRFYQFHRQILDKLSMQGKAFIKVLTLNDRPLAAYYVFQDKGQMHYYQSGFYADWANRYSPLFLLVCNEIGGASSAGQLFDFMYAEDADCYKNRQYGAVAEPMCRFLCTHQAWRLKVYLLLREVKKRSNQICTRLKRLRRQLVKRVSSNASDRQKKTETGQKQNQSCNHHQKKIGDSRI